MAGVKAKIRIQAEESGRGKHSMSGDRLLSFWTGVRTLVRKTHKDKVRCAETGDDRL